QGISAVMANRHAFEALGSGLDLDELDGTGMAGFADAFDGPAGSSWLVLAGFTAVFVLCTVLVLHRRSRTYTRG
ncbi:MAG TPA: hypothetical protein VFZ85_01510, partial [Jiangellaceae bacterium]